MQFSFVHASDLHLDTPFGGLGRIADELPEALQGATIRAWQRLVDLTLEQRAAFLLLAGDIFDGAEKRGVRAQLAFRDGLQRLSDAGIPTFIAYGNHDPLDGPGWQAIKAWPEGVTIFDSSRVASVPVKRHGQLLATIHGISYANRETRENLALRFRRTEAEGIHVGVLHASVGDQPEHTPYSPCSLDDLRRANLDYWALGHIHTRQHLQQGTPWVVYPGNFQGLSMKPSERGAKGVLVVDVHDGRIQAPRFVPLGPIQFEQVEIDIATTSDVSELIERIREQAGALRRNSRADGMVVRVLLTGRGDLYDDLIQPNAVAELHAELRRQAQHGLWWESLRNQAQPALDLAALRGGQSLPSELIREVDRLRQDQAALTNLLERVRAEGARLPSATGLAAAEDDALLDDALSLALDLLLSGARS